MDYEIDVDQLLEGFDTPVDCKFVIYQSGDGIATIMDADSSEIFILETLH